MAPGEKSPHLAGPKSMRQNGKCPCCASIPVAAAGWPARFFRSAQKQGNRFRSFARPSRKPFQMIFGSLPSPALWRSPVIWFCWSCLRIFKPPKGRLILPQVQTMRELFGQAMFRYELHGRLLGSNLGGPAHPPKLIITDSQVFPSVWKAKPAESLLTPSPFSLLVTKETFRPSYMGPKPLHL